MNTATLADLDDLTAFHNSIEDLDAISADMDLETELYYLEDLTEGADFMAACALGL